MASWSIGVSSKVLIDRCPALCTSLFEQHYSRPFHPYPTGKRGIVWISAKPPDQRGAIFSFNNLKLTKVRQLGQD